MSFQDDAKDYVSWSDVHEAVRYVEAGFGVRLKFVMTVACPKGEQWLLQYYEIHICDSELRECAMQERVLGSFPSRGHKSLAACLLGLVYKADSLLSQTKPWTEPTIAAKPRRGPAAH